MLPANKQSRKAIVETAQSERLAILDAFAGGNARKLNTPRGAMKIAAEHAHAILRISQNLDTVQDCLAKTLKDTQHCVHIVKHVLHFALYKEPIIAPVTRYYITQGTSTHQSN